jgi:phospholipid/cholesterol/gamma-HCH transport system substrate-binding protein
MIPSQKGDIEEFLERLPDVITRAASVMMRVEQVLSDENIDSLSTTLANVQLASEELPAIAKQANALTSEMHRTASELSALTIKLHNITETSQPDLQASIASVRETADHLSRTASSLEQIVSGNEASLSQFAGPGVADIHQLVIDVRDTSNEIRALAQSLRENPASLLQGSPRNGVELPR